MDDDFKVPVEDKIRYLQRRINQVSGIVDAGVVDYELAEKLGHQIRGNADTFEFPNLTAPAKELETKAQSRDEVAVKMLIEKLLKLMHAYLQAMDPE